ncbi:MAG TPA: response regulator [Polyangiaceae bacterium]|nr:response regulator [Polyangiaceae bacterium]
MLKLVMTVIAEPSLQQSVQRQLKALLFDVTTASNAETAITELETKKPHLVCIDLRLPRDSGYEVCEFMRRTPRLRDVPILVMSEAASAADRAYAEEAGADGFLPKPFTPNQFSEQVRGLMAGDPLSMRRLRRIY